MRLLPALGLLAVAGAIPAPKIPSLRRPGWRGSDFTKRLTPTTSDSTSTSTVSAPKKNPWLYLSNDEAAAVYAYLHAQPDLNLTAVAKAGAWDNTVMVLDLAPPPKSAVVAYLDSDGPCPDRYAVASLLLGVTEEPYVQDWLVGPLPISNATTHVPHDAVAHVPEAKIRVYDLDDHDELLVATAMEMKDIISDLLNATIDTEDDLNAEFQLWGIDPLWHEEIDGMNRTINWVGFWRNSPEVQFENSTAGFDGETLLPQGLYLSVDITGRDPAKWFVRGVVYGGEFYPSVADFRAAWEAPGFKKYTPNMPGNWVGTDKVGEPLPLESLPPPMSVQPSGQRFKVDMEEKYVEWMDFSFYLTFTRDTGLRLHDIKYKGERVVYELGLQEAVAHYAGNDPVQSGVAYLDSYYGFGPYAFTQVPGFDVPAYATCLDSKFHAYEISKTHRCGITIFEADQNFVLQRHTSTKIVSATKNIALTVRSVSTIGNYDYTFDYVFYLDGSFETLVRASGYIQSAYYAANDEYGGSMHDHVLTFKADLDVLGTANTMVKHSVEPATVQYPWHPTPRNTMHLVKSVVVSEDDGRQHWGHNAKDQVLIVNKDALNKFGEERGWKMMPSRGGAGMALTVQNSSNLAKSGSFVTHPFYVTKHKDEENRVASAWNAYDPQNPIIDFSKFFNNESLVQEDIVVWYNLGMHHVPHTGDLPNTVMTTAQAGLMFTPHNYLLSDPSRAVTNQIRINYNNTATTDVETFGAQPLEGVIELQQPWDAFSYAGDIAIRKFPYDPTNPFNHTGSNLSID